MSVEWMPDISYLCAKEPKTTKEVKPGKKEKKTQPWSLKESSDVNSGPSARVIHWWELLSNRTLDFLIRVLLMDFSHSSKG